MEAQAGAGRKVRGADPLLGERCQGQGQRWGGGCLWTPGSSGARARDPGWGLSLGAQIPAPPIPGSSASGNSADLPDLHSSPGPSAETSGPANSQTLEKQRRN